jgi:hypothetical protein
MEAQIQVRRATAAQWISANPILASGEPGLETDTGKGKYGDGATHWINLDYSWSKLGGGPIGPAGGSLAGTYPNPTLALNTVGAPQITDGSVGSAELASNAVTTVKVTDGAVTTPKIGDAQVTGAKLAPNAVDSSKIADGSVAVTDLAPATVSALKLDVLDEGAPILADADILNFVGAGVSVTSGSGIATVSITGAPASAVLAGTILEWHDPVPPPGWYLCDGSVKADLAGTLGTKYGTTAGTLPTIFPRAQDASTTTIGNVIASTQPGWQVNSVNARRSGNICLLVVQTTRTGGLIDMANPNNIDQTMASVVPTWSPPLSIAASCNNAPRWGSLTGAGNLMLTSGFANDTYNSSDILKDDVFVLTMVYPVSTTAGIPLMYSIIKAP